MTRSRTTAAVALAALFASLCAACERRGPYTGSTFVMGTTAWVTITGRGESEAAEAADAVFRELYRIESVMSTWKSSSELSRLNADARGLPIGVSGELYALVDSALSYSRMTFGAFDATIRPLVLLWGFQGGEPRLPSQAAIDSARSLVGWERVALDSAAFTITLPPGMQIDVAGIAKGYAVDRSAVILAERGIRSALVNLGGNIRAIGRPADSGGWRIGVRDPLGGTATVGIVQLVDAAIATSGNYENFVEVDGRRYGHLIDPRSGRPVESVLSVTVVAPTALAADALSTGFFILGPAETAAALEALGGVAALFALPADDRIEYKTIGDFRGRLVLEEGAGGPR